MATASTTPPSAEKAPAGWTVSLASFGFVLVQSACTLLMALSGFRLLIGLSALAAVTAGINAPETGLHADRIRIPMMLLALGGALFNLYSVWRMRRLRARPAAQWRTGETPRARLRSENVQVALSIMTLFLFAVELASHVIVFRHLQH